MNNNFIRCMGIRQTFQEHTDKRRKEVSNREQSVMLRNLAAMPSMSFTDYAKYVEESSAKAGVTGWRRWIPGRKDQPELDELKINLRVVQTMTPEQRAEASSVNGLSRPTRQLVATAASTSVETINKVLSDFESMKQAHSYLRTRHERALPIPSNPDELRRMLEDDILSNARKNERPKLTRLEKNVATARAMVDSVTNPTGVNKIIKPVYARETPEEKQRFAMERRYERWKSRHGQKHEPR